MACEICGRGACARSFHSIADQMAYDERQSMSDDVETLRCEIQDLRNELSAAHHSEQIAHETFAVMLTQRDELLAALKKALEALETCQPGDYSTGTICYPSFNEEAVGHAYCEAERVIARVEAK